MCRSCTTAPSNQVKLIAINISKKQKKKVNFDNVHDFSCLKIKHLFK